MPKKRKKPTARKTRNWAAVNAHFRRNGVTDKESQDNKGKKDRRKTKIGLRKYRY